MNLDPESGEDEAPLQRDSKEERRPTTEADRAERRRMWMATGHVGYIGIFFGIAVGITYFAGRWLDGRFDTYPWFTIVFVLLGVATGAKELFTVAKRLQAENPD